METLTGDGLEKFDPVNMTCSKSSIKTGEKGVKYVQNW